jgi:hypothetical protein
MRVYKPYWEWEDFNNGMWRKVNKKEELIFLEKAIIFTGDHLRYGEAMKEVIDKWTNTMLNTLTNSSVNKRAFLGHCACSLAFNCPEYITRMAWKELTNMQRELADEVAQQHIDNWTNEYTSNSTGLHKNLGKQMLLQWGS